MIYIISAIILFCLLYTVAAVYLGYTVYAMISAAPFVPTKREVVREMLALSGLKAGERMADFGSGDGRIVFAAARLGAQGLGIEINPILFWKSRFRAWRAGVRGVEFRRQSFWDVSLRDTDVLTLFCINHKMYKLKKKVLREMRPGSRVVSHGFSFPDWPYAKKHGKVYLYVVYPSG